MSANEASKLKLELEEESERKIVGQATTMFNNDNDNAKVYVILKRRNKSI